MPKGHKQSENVDVMCVIAEYWIKLEDDGKGIEILKKAEQLNPRSQDYIEMALLWYDKLNNMENAVHCAKKAEATEKGSYHLVAECWEKLGREEDMERCYKLDEK